MNPDKNRLIILKQRPESVPDAHHFALIEQDIAPLQAGEILVKNHFMSVDPYMRSRMREGKSYVPPFQLGKPLDGGAVGEIIDSKHPDYKIGQYVLHSYGWRDVALIEVAKDPQLTAVDPDIAPLAAYLGVLGMPGLTAYAGIVRLAQVSESDTVFVSAGAGAVGSIVGQIAKIKGARVIGSAGGGDKCRYLVNELGFDGAIDYRSQAVGDALKQQAPEGIDVYFDNVGHNHLEAAISAMNPHGRIIVCGMIAHYNDPKAHTGPKNFIEIIPKRLTIKGLLVMDHTDLLETFYQDMGSWITAGKVQYNETIIQGLERAPSAFCGLFVGNNVGKMLVKL